MDWDRLRVFHAVAEAGSFTHAGDGLGLSQSAVSRQIGALEESLNCHLFHRHPRGLILTEQGDLLFRTVRDVFAKLAMVEARLAESKDKPEGPLKINATVGFGSVWLTPRLKDFMEHYPDIELSLLLTDGELDLSMREADVAIRLSEPTQPDLIQRHLTTMNFHIYASALYIKKHGMPHAMADLDRHRLIAFGNEVRPPLSSLNWILEVGAEFGRRRQAFLKVNNLYGIFQAVSHGIGLGILPEYLTHESRDLVKILPDVHGPSVDVYFVYPEEQRHSRRIAVFRDFIVRRIAEERF